MYLLCFGGAFPPDLCHDRGKGGEMSTTPKANGRRALALERMTDAELTVRLAEVRKTLSTINDNARGCSYYKSIPQVKAEYDRNQNQKHRIVKILARRQQQAEPTGRVFRVEYFTLSDGRTAKDVRAVSEDAARSMVQDSGDCEMIVNVSVN